ncbi:MAG: beta-glycosidase [Dysgonamonadaceae bacterium]|jgi:glucosylceramidase|nr:beta-glycosidase [Dysgonamonadaceae bacterium]
MKKLLLSVCVLMILSACGKKAEWVATTPDELWQKQDAGKIEFVAGEKPDATVEIDAPQQTVEGFGACFNELGWTSLGLISDYDRGFVMHELFAPGAGANLTVCRLPIAANDFARDWYSYDEIRGDFGMETFSIDNDRETLIPFIKAAQHYNPALKLWASPWSPPLWMKDNGHYACATLSDFFDQRFTNDIQPEQLRAEGMNMFIQEDAYFKAYALYFKKFVEAYGAEGIKISMVMPQNEFNSCQPFPSCTWKIPGLIEFIGKYLGPEMQSVGVDVMFGTMERPNPAMVDSVLNDPECRKYITGVGFQWAGKEALPEIHKNYPELAIYQTEQECGDGKNDWEGCVYSWDLMKHYFGNGANVYDYWNISLKAGGLSRWGWAQNSLVVIDTVARTYRYTYEYYLLKHASHYVLPGAKYLPVSGDFTDMMAFQNPDGKYILIIYNAEDEEVSKIIKTGEKSVKITLKPQSFNTIRL